MTLPPRNSRRCRHRIPIGGVEHQVQSEFVAGNPLRVDSQVTVAGRVVVQRSVPLDSVEPPSDAEGMTRLLENRQKSTIRYLVEARRQELVAQRDSAVTKESAQQSGKGPASDQAAGEARLRRHIVRFARGVERLVAADSNHADKLRRLIHETAILLADEDERSRSREVAELHLLRAEAERCLGDAGAESCEELLVAEFSRMAADLLKVNDRSSLRAYDLAILERVDLKLQRKSDNVPLGEEIEHELLLVWGRDRQLDEQMAMHSDLRVGDVRLPLRRTLERLRRERAAN